MGDKSGIEWTDATWSPVIGCTHCSAGCVNCWAPRSARRQSAPGKKYHGLTVLTKRGPKWNGQVAFAEDALADPLRWRAPRKIFVCDMGDLFHEDVPDEWIDRVFAVMALAPHHTFQVLTKRPERMRAYLTASRVDRRIWWAGRPIATKRGKDMYDEVPVPVPCGGPDGIGIKAWPLPNVHLGVSVENQETADERIPLLLQTPAAVRFLSVEPLLEPVDLTWIGHDDEDRDGVIDALRGEDWIIPSEHMGSWNRTSRHVTATGPRLDWVIVGGESGPAARPCDLAGIRSIVAQCKAAGTPCFVKQIGARPFIADLAEEIRLRPADYSVHLVAGSGVYLRLRDRKGGSPEEWPADLRVREFPR